MNMGGEATDHHSRLRGHMPALDGLRGLAILLVLCYHSRQPGANVSGFTAEKVYYALASWGWSGVDLFFVLSGFLITGILLDSKVAPFYFRNFYARRTLRIFPLYYGILILLFVVLRPTIEANEDYRAALHHQYWFWTYTHNWWMAITNPNVKPLTHLWSLAVEEQFYLFWPLIVRHCGKRAIALWCIFFTFAAPILRTGLVLLGVSPLSIQWATVCRLDTLSVGGLLAVLVRTGIDLSRLANWVGLLAIGATALSVALAIICQPHNLLQTLGLLVLALLFGAGLMYAVSLPSRHIAVRCLEWKPLRFVGRVSYGIYVFHWFVVLQLNNHWKTVGLSPGLGNQIAFLMVLLSISLMLATLSWYLYERRFLAFKNHFTVASSANGLSPASTPPTL